MVRTQFLYGLDNLLQSQVFLVVILYLLNLLSLATSSLNVSYSQGYKGLTNQPPTAQAAHLQWACPYDLSLLHGSPTRRPL